MIRDYSKALPTLVIKKNEPWAIRHNEAITQPTQREAALLSAFDGVSRLVLSEFVKGPDGVLTPGVASILDGLRTLLNADCGRLDCGTLDAHIMRLMEKAHVNPDTLEVRWE